MNYNIPGQLTGLSDEELKESRQRFGMNRTETIRRRSFFLRLFEILKEPMLILLIAVSVIYILVGDYGEALFMIGAIVAVSGISFYQDSRSLKALEELEKLNEPLSTVIRNSVAVRIPTHEIAVGDLCVVEEGKMINADGIIVHSNDFSVNEASLTGESFSVFKARDSEDNSVYSGTLVVSGLAVFEVSRIGSETRLGKIGKSLQEIREERSPLQNQIQQFVKWMAVIGIAIFFMVWFYSYLQIRDFVESLLIGLTMAMSVLPEEIPVAFTTFMALGAWKLMQKGIIVKRSNVSETLGSTTVICTDKTGTITENSMHLKALYDFRTNRIYEETEFSDPALAALIDYAMWSSEPVPFDPMEKTLHQVYETSSAADLRSEFRMSFEYPLEGKPPMMTHVLKNRNGDRIIAAKGAPEAIIAVSGLAQEDEKIIRDRIADFGKKGYRVLGVARSGFPDHSLPEKQQDLPFEFLGLTVFYDPPKKGIKEVFQKINKAGIKVKVITGDSAETTVAIAAQAGIKNESPAVNGADIVNHTREELIALSEKTTLYTRMFPEAKLAMVNALKEKGEVVAMLGDGVNDAPALKAAHIGVAMGTKGTEIAKAAASLIITDDDLNSLITGIAEGRRIYDNIKKAVQYIISIHIPIIMTVSLPLFLGWVYPQIFTPVHVIFLELIMGPTCSIVYENEPMEKDTMLRKPRAITQTFLNRKELAGSILQGLVITLGVMAAYQYAIHNSGSEEKTRAMVLSTLILANILLSFANRSFIFSIFESFKNKNRLFPIIIGFTLLALFAILYIPAVAGFFHVTGLTFSELAVAGFLAAVSVLWFEIYKWTKRVRTKKTPAD